MEGTADMVMHVALAVVMRYPEVPVLNTCVCILVSLLILRVYLCIQDLHGRVGMFAQRFEEYVVRGILCARMCACVWVSVCVCVCMCLHICVCVCSVRMSLLPLRVWRDRRTVCRFRESRCCQRPLWYCRPQPHVALGAACCRCRVEGGKNGGCQSIWCR